MNAVSFNGHTYPVKDLVIGYDTAEPGGDKSMMVVGHNVDGILCIEDSFELKVEPGAVRTIMKMAYNKKNFAYRGKRGSWYLRNMMRKIS